MLVDDTNNFNTHGIRVKGKNVYIYTLPDGPMSAGKAPSFYTMVSRIGKIYKGSLWFFLVAKRSDVGLQYILKISSKTQGRGSHSLAVIWTRWANCFVTILSFPGMCLTNEVPPTRSSVPADTGNEKPCHFLFKYATMDVWQVTNTNKRPMILSWKTERVRRTALFSQELICMSISWFVQSHVCISYFSWAPSYSETHI